MFGEMSRMLVTGGAGFIGSFYARQVQDDYELTVVDSLSYCGNRENLEGVNHDFVRQDVNDISSLDGFEVIVHFAAETHVDNSIESSGKFMKSNVLGTWNILEHLRNSGSVEQFIYISTDEVYGDVPAGVKSGEEDCFSPSNPYSASKASADLLCQAYHRTYGVPVKIVRPSNCYGPRQHPEKLIPLFVKNAVEGEKLPVYGDGRQRRCWLHVVDLCNAVKTVIDEGDFGQAYNVGGVEMENLDVIHVIQDVAGGEIEFVDDRPGHDRRYCVDDSRLRRLGWKMEEGGFMDKLAETVKTYIKI